MQGRAWPLLIIFMSLNLALQVRAQSEIPAPPAAALEPESTAPAFNANRATTPTGEEQAAVPKPKKKSKKSTKVNLKNLKPDSPDVAQEEKFYDHYRKFGKAPTSSKAWDTGLNNSNSKTYTVQNGDTLSGISQLLFGEPNFWPKIWSQNSEGILNPHEINPTQEIKFFPGSIDAAPSVGVQSSTAVSNVFANPKKVVIPRLGRPVLKSLPPSLPLYKFSINDNRAEFEVSGKPITFSAPSIPLTVYATDEKVQGLGRVIESSYGEHKLAPGQYVTVKMFGNHPAGEYLAVRNHEIEYRNENRDWVKVPFIEVLGRIQVKGQLKANELFYHAEVIDSLNPIELGDILIKENVTNFEVKKNGSELPEAKIVGGYFMEEQSFFAANTFVFLNKGSDAGVKEGMVGNIETTLAPTIENAHNGMARVIGQIQIVKVAKGFATGYIIKSVDMIQVGDRVGSASVTATPDPEMGSMPEALPQNSQIQNDNPAATPQAKTSDDELNFSDPSNEAPVPSKNPKSTEIKPEDPGSGELEL